MPWTPTESTSFARNSMTAVGHRWCRLVDASHRVIAVWRTAPRRCAAVRTNISEIELGTQDGRYRPDLLGSRHGLSNGWAGAHCVDVFLSGGVTAHDVDEGLDICMTGSPAFQDIVRDGRDHDATPLGGQPVEEVRPAMQPG
jgi:hypothetical protein